MTIADKLKEKLHIGSGKSDTTATEPAGTGSNTGRPVEPQTGPEAYKPLHKGAGSQEAATGSHGGSARRAHKSGVTGGSVSSSPSSSDDEGNAGTRKASKRNIATGGTQGQSEGVSGASSGTAGAAGAGAGAAAGGEGVSHFKQGYKADEPGFSSEYKSGEPLYKESVQRGSDGSYSADLQAEQDNKHWKQARELTEAAEREVASAKLSGQRANKELASAEKAEDAVNKAQIKHREALQEAEKYKAIMGDSQSKEADVAEARELYNSRRHAADQAEAELRRAEEELRRQKRELEGLRPKVSKFGENLPSLEEELAARQRDRAAAEGDRDKTLAWLQEAEGKRSGYASDVEYLLKDLEEAEQDAARRQQEYLDARQVAQNISQRVEDLKARLRNLDNDLLGARNRADEADRNLPQYLEAEQRAERELESSRGEWSRLKELEEEYSRNYTSAQERFNGLKGSFAPHSKELQDSQSTLRAREDDLSRARDRSASAEKKYRDLLSLADRHRKYGDSAAGAAEKHGQKFQDAKQEANIHGDKHVEYWHAAREEGDTGSTESTNVIKKLEQRVKELTHRNEA